MQRFRDLKNWKSTNFFAFAIKAKNNPSYRGRLRQPGAETNPNAKPPKNEFFYSLGFLAAAALLMGVFMNVFSAKSPYGLPRFAAFSSTSDTAPTTVRPIMERKEPKVAAKIASKAPSYKRAAASSAYPYDLPSIENDEDELAPKEAKKAPADKDKINGEIDRALDLVDSGKVEEAKQLLEGLVEKDPENSRALTELAMLHILDMQDNAAGMEYLKRSLSLDPSDAFAIKNYTRSCAALGRTDVCLEFLDRIEKNVGSEIASQAIIAGKAQLLSEDKRFDEAIPKLESSVSSGDASAQTFAELANAYKENGQVGKALDALEAAAERAREGADTEIGQENHMVRELDYVNELERQGKAEMAAHVMDKLIDRYGKNKVAEAATKYENKRGFWE